MICWSPFLAVLVNQIEISGKLYCILHRSRLACTTLRSLVRFLTQEPFVRKAFSLNDQVRKIKEKRDHIFCKKLNLNLSVLNM